MEISIDPDLLERFYICISCAANSIFQDSSAYDFAILYFSY